MGSEYSSLTPLMDLKLYFWMNDRLLHDVIFSSFEEPLAGYICKIYAPKAGPASLRQRNSENLLIKRLRLFMEDHHSQDEIQTAVSEIRRHRTINTGPHCQLLLDRDFFSTTLATYSGMKPLGLRFLPVFTGSTCKFRIGKDAGPGYLNVGEHNLNVFGLSRNAMERYNVVALKGAFSFQFEGVEKLPAGMKAAMHYVQDLSVGISSGSAAEAFRELNSRLLNVWTNGDFTLVPMDDLFVADLAADHLLEKQSMFGELIDCAWVAERLLHEVSVASQRSPLGLIPAGTDFFWEVYGGKIHPLRLENGRLVSSRGRASIGFERSSLCEALSARRIIPSALVTFLLLSFYPAFRVLGGPRQIYYLPALIRAFHASLSEGDKEEYGNALLSTSMSGWGMPLIETDINNLQMSYLRGERGLLSELCSHYSVKTLGSASRDLERFRKYPIWKGIVSAYVQDLRSKGLDIVPVGPGVACDTGDGSSASPM